MHFKCEQGKSGELAGEQFLQAVRVTFWHIGDSDVLEIQPVLSGQRRTLASDAVQVGDGVRRDRRKIVHVASWTR